MSSGMDEWSEAYTELSIRMDKWNEARQYEYWNG
jgi:hypothetical protein